MIYFRTGAEPRALLQLRTLEDVFVLGLESKSIPTGRSGLAIIRAQVSEAAGLDGAVTTAFQVRPRRRGKPTFRVIARKAGEHAFRRVDLQRATELGIQDRFPTWRLVEDDAQIEVWVHLTDRELLASVRLSDTTMRQREYRRTSLPAALKPTIAAGMVMLSVPTADDVFLDPMCGAGTLLIERGEAGRYRRLLGGDSNPLAVQATRDNVGPRYQPIEIRHWDARSLPVEDNSVTTIVTNLPFGKQIGTVEQNRVLYPALLREWRRVLQAGGKLVLLTSERVLLRRTLEVYPEWTRVNHLPVIVRGQSAEISVLHDRRDR